MDNGSKIREIVDRTLQKWFDLGLDSVPVQPPPSMAASADCNEESYWRWVPTASTVTVEDLASLEATIGFALPTAYKLFLQHKHFYDLNISEADFLSHVDGSWQNDLLEEWYNGAPRDELIDKGYLPFAGWAGAGDLLCFDTNRNEDSHDYPIVLWNHESGGTDDFSPNFISLLIGLDAEEQQKRRGS